MTTCPCCSSPLLRHIRHHNVYWFCRSCWQEMPNCSALPSVRSRQIHHLESLLNRSSLGRDRRAAVLQELL